MASTTQSTPNRTPWLIMLVGLVFIVGSVSVLLLGLSQRKNAATTQNDQNAAPSRGILFEAISADQRSRIWLMGSMHVLRAADHPLPEAYQDAFDQADTVVFELPVGALHSPDAAVIFENATHYPDGSKLRDHLSKPAYQRAAKAAVTAGVDFKALAGKQVYVLAQTFGFHRLNTSGYAKDWGVDTVFKSEAVRQNKPTLALETLEGQLNVFATLDDDRQEALLLHTLDEMEAHPADYGLRAFAPWRSGDVDALAELSTESMAADPSLGNALLFERHQRWLPIILENARPDTTLLVIVGAAHLCGEQSITAMLENSGYVIRQL